MNYIFHGSYYPKILSNPKFHRRVKFNIDGNREVKFEGVSFHASPFKWIALAYLYNPYFSKNNFQYNIEIPLNKPFSNEITIHGLHNLEESLIILYGKGGYLHNFSNEYFYWEKGLGLGERITNKVIPANSVEYIQNPVMKLKELGVKFNFIDLAKRTKKNAE